MPLKKFALFCLVMAPLFFFGLLFFSHYEVALIFGKNEVDLSLVDLTERVEARMKDGPFANWRHPFEQPADFDFTKRIKTREPQEALFFQPGTRIHTYLSYKDVQQKVYDVNYSFDAEGFRASSAPRGIAPVSKTLFLGCSFTFGEGLNDEETSASRFGQMKEGRQVINYGSSGYGPNDILLELKKNNPRAASLMGPVDTVVYTALQDHIERTNCSLYYCLKYADYAPERLNAPAFEVVGDKLVHKGSFKELFPWNQNFLRYFAQRFAFESLSNTSLFSKRELDLTVRVLAEIKTDLKSRWNVQRFIVVLYPGHWDHRVAQVFAQHLRDQKIEVLNLSNVIVRPRPFDFFYKLDGHPSPAGAYYYALVLDEYLK